MRLLQGPYIDEPPDQQIHDHKSTGLQKAAQFMAFAGPLDFRLFGHARPLVQFANLRLSRVRVST